MVNNFSSLSSHHPNWPQQQPVGGLDGACGGGDQEFSQVLPPRQMPPMGGGVTDRGRMRKPDTAMKCPRCESTNTKFCYFNNYSLSQPRHFCKSCRRYWTRGGALRNVPMGGGCRRNKKTTKGSSRASRSKSPGATTSNVLGHSPHTTRPPQFPILPPMHHYPGLTFGAGNGNDLINTGGDHASNYPNKIFAHFSILEATDGGYGEQIEGMKMEENHHQQQHQGMNMSRNFLGISGNYDQFLGTSNAAWGTTDHLSGLTSSSTNTACYPSLLN